MGLAPPTDTANEDAPVIDKTARHGSKNEKKQKRKQKCTKYGMVPKIRDKEDVK